MKSAACVLALLATSVFAQTGTKPDNPGAQVQRDAELHLRALRAVRAEQLHATQPLCPSATTTLAINACLANELSITDGNYLTLARALGALMRNGEETDNPTPIPFDQAETTWRAYRDQACTVAGSIYEGGSIRPSVEMNCRLTLTRHHIDELWTLYSDLKAH